MSNVCQAVCGTKEMLQWTSATVIAPSPTAEA
jgi:hypothetical protein